MEPEPFTVPCLACEEPIDIGARRKVDICKHCWALLDWRIRMAVINAWGNRHGAPATFQAAVDFAVAAVWEQLQRPVETIEPAGGVL